MVNTEAEPLDPDELLTVGLLRKVLTNYALLKGQEDFVVELTGEDDEATPSRRAGRMCW